MHGTQVGFDLQHHYPPWNVSLWKVSMYVGMFTFRRPANSHAGISDLAKVNIEQGRANEMPSRLFGNGNVTFKLI